VNIEDTDDELDDMDVEVLRSLLEDMVDKVVLAEEENLVLEKVKTLDEYMYEADSIPDSDLSSMWSDLIDTNMEATADIDNEVDEVCLEYSRRYVVTRFDLTHAGMLIDYLHFPSSDSSTGQRKKRTRLSKPNRSI
jgi:hypothetical protein